MMKTHTYKEWKSLGFQVTRGEKSTGRNANGEATFKETQVVDIDVEEGYDFLSSEEMEFVCSDYFSDMGDR